MVNVNFFKQGQIEVPRWTILVLDQVLAVSVFLVSYFSIRSFDLQSLFLGHILTYTLLYIFFSVSVFYFMKIHTGLIRYSNSYDLIKIMKALFFSSLLFFIVVQGYWEIGFGTYSKNVNALLIFNFILASSVLILVRITLKEVFNFARATANTNQSQILICGTGHSSLFLKHAIEAGNINNYSVVGFLSHSPKRINSFIEQKPVFQYDQIETAKNSLKIKKILVTRDLLTNSKVNELIDRCIKLEIQVITVPAPEDWISGTLKNNQIQDLRIEDLLYREPIKLENEKIFKLCAGKRILITGAAGSIGSEIVRQVLKLKPSLVILLDQAETPLHDISLEVLPKHSEIDIKPFIGDIRNSKRMYKVFSQYKPQIIFHAAAYKHVPLMEENPSEAVLTNVLGTKNIADLAINFKAETFIMISSDKAVNPANVMGASKRIAETYIQAIQNKEIPWEDTCETSFIITRFGNVLGSNGSVIPRFNTQIKMGGPITVTHPEITRYFMTIPEAVQLVLEAAIMGTGSEIFVFDMGKSVKIKDLALKMIELSGLQPYKDINIVYTGLRPGEKLYEELLSDTEHTQPTHHSLIKIAKRGEIQAGDTIKRIHQLIESTYKGEIDDVDLVIQMKTIVSEFVSKNSRFELLDTEVA